jgi:hypothetical protein
MDLLKKQFILSLACLIITGISIAAQPTVDLAFQGMLSDIRGNRISSEPFNLLVKVLSIPDKEILWQSQSTATTDEEGWFGYSITDISRYMVKEGEMKIPVIIQMEFLPVSTTSWMSAGDDFMVTYTLSPTMTDQSIQMKMTRMEGSDLVVHSEEHLYAFKDQYPFAYLTGGFVLTDQPPVARNSVEDLRQWLAPPGDTEPGSVSRGVKGGFPVGGYRKKN